MYEFVIIIAEPKETTHLSNHLRLRPLKMASIFFGLVSMPFSETMCPRYSTLFLKNLHFDGFRWRPAWSNFSNTDCSHLMCSFGIVENTIMSSKYIMQYWRWRSPKQDSINLWNVAGALVRPNGILTHS